MTAPEPLSVPADIEGRLKRYMTVAGYELALTLFGVEGILDAVATNGGNLRLAAAELLEGLPDTSATTEGGAGGLKRFKLDVLEFEYQTNKTAVSTDWSAIAKRLRAQAAGGDGTPRPSANPTPILEPVGIDDGWWRR